MRWSGDCKVENKAQALNEMIKCPYCKGVTPIIDRHTKRSRKCPLCGLKGRLTRREVLRRLGVRIPYAVGA